MFSMAATREQLVKVTRSLRWMPRYVTQRLTRPGPPRRAQLIIAIADHFEPAIVPERSHAYAGRDVQLARLERWCREYPRAVESWRDSEGRPLRHTYFYPAEQYDKEVIDRLADHCHQGWGEVEIHLHHGVDAPDTKERTRSMLSEFRDRLAAHGCLSLWDGLGAPRYGFVHGNWALANSAGGRFCGVDDEMLLLAQTGCYGDFTLPSAPAVSQTAKINALYECGLPLGTRAPHRWGTALQVGRKPRVFPLIVQGPLGINFSRRIGRWPVPCIENSALTTANPPSVKRLSLWRRAAISVRGRPEWIFIKLHCHGMDPRDEAAMVGAPLQQFLKDVTEQAKRGGDAIHFVTTREMVNIALAACDGRSGNPAEYRDYRLRLITPTRAV
jgi:hypothetical protein